MTSSQSTACQSEAQQIIRLHTEATQLSHERVRKAWEIGTLLVSVKSQLSHGHYGEWCRINIEPKVSKPSHYRYRQLAEKCPNWEKDLLPLLSKSEGLTDIYGKLEIVSASKSAVGTTPVGKPIDLRSTSASSESSTSGKMPYSLNLSHLPSDSESRQQANRPISLISGQNSIAYASGQGKADESDPPRIQGETQRSDYANYLLRRLESWEVELNATIALIREKLTPEASVYEIDGDEGQSEMMEIAGQLLDTLCPMVKEIASFKDSFGPVSPRQSSE